MPRFYMDVTAEKPAPGARIPVAGEAAASFVAARADMERMACAQVDPTAPVLQPRRGRAGSGPRRDGS